MPCASEFKALGQIDGAHHASPESATLRSLSERLTLVTAVTGILLRHGCKIPKSPYTTYYYYLCLRVNAAFIYLFYY